MLGASSEPRGWNRCPPSRVGWLPSGLGRRCRRAARTQDSTGIRTRWEPTHSVRSGPCRQSLALGREDGAVPAMRVVSCRVVWHRIGWMDGWIVFRFDGEPPHDPPHHGGCATTRHTRRRPPETAFQGIVDRPPSPFLVPAAHHRSGARLCLASFRVPREYRTVSHPSVPCIHAAMERPIADRRGRRTAMQCNAMRWAWISEGPPWVSRRLENTSGSKPFVGGVTKGTGAPNKMNKHGAMDRQSTSDTTRHDTTTAPIPSVHSRTRISKLARNAKTSLSKEGGTQGTPNKRR